MCSIGKINLLFNMIIRKIFGLILLLTCICVITTTFSLLFIYRQKNTKPFATTQYLQFDLRRGNNNAARRNKAVSNHSKHKKTDSIQNNHRAWPNNYKIWSDNFIHIAEGKKYSDYGDETCEPNNRKKRLKKILKRWNSFCKKNNITYFLGYGSLLGAWRNEDLIPWDLDLDVFVTQNDAVQLDMLKEQSPFPSWDNRYHLLLQKDWKKLVVEDRRRFNCPGELVSEQIDLCSFQEPLGRFMKGECHLDIFTVNITNNNNNVMAQYEEDIFKFPIQSVFPLHKCMFIKQECYCPKDTKLVLNVLFKGNLVPDQICKNGTYIH